MFGLVDPVVVDIDLDGDMPASVTFSRGCSTAVSMERPPAS
jgi:hypothetical protein